MVHMATPPKIALSQAALLDLALPCVSLSLAIGALALKAYDDRRYARLFLDNWQDDVFLP